MKKSLRIVSAFFAAVILFTLCSVLSYSAKIDEIQWHNEEDKKAYEQAKERLDEIEAQKKELEAQLKALSSEKSSKVKKKNLIETQILNTNTEIETLEWVLDELSVRLGERTVDLENTEAEYNDYYSRYKARIRESYELGATSYLEILLSASSFTDLLTRIDIISNIVEYDRETLNTLGTLRDKVATEKADIENQLIDQQVVLAQCEEAKTSLIAQKKNLEAAIRDLNNDKEALEDMEYEYEKASQKLDAQILELIQSNAVYTSGELMWPVAIGKSYRVSSGFGWRTLNGKKGFHNAIDIAAPEGTHIYAATDGTFVHAKWVTTGGGNQIMLDHGGNLFTQYNHLDGFAKNPKTGKTYTAGDTVKKGDLIGYVGSTGNSTGNHLDFKIIYKTKTLPSSIKSMGLKEDVDYQKSSTMIYLNPLLFVTFDNKGTPKFSIKTFLFG